MHARNGTGACLAEEQGGKIKFISEVCEGSEKEKKFHREGLVSFSLSVRRVNERSVSEKNKKRRKE